MLRMLRDLQGSESTTRSLQIRYRLSHRTILRYFNSFREAGYTMLNLADGYNKMGLWKIELEKEEK